MWEQRPRRDLSLALTLTLLFSACAETSPPAQSQAARPPATPAAQRAGEPVSAAEIAARLAAGRAAALVGDNKGAHAQVEAIEDDLRRSIKIADPARLIDREAARMAARSVTAVRSAVWIDNANLLVLVDNEAARAEATIDTICRALEPLGDTLAVVINLQNATALSGDELATLSRNCQLAPGDRAFLQPNRQVDVVSPDLRAQFQAQQSEATNDPERQRRAEEAARVIERTTLQVGEGEQ
jgi:hypothetical protein